MKDKEKEKPRYNMWQNTGFMVRTAWEKHKSVLFLCLALALTTAAQSVVELLIAPMILREVEQAAPLGTLITAIVLFAAALMLLSGLKEYLDTNAIFGRIKVRMVIVQRISAKNGKTSYPNLMDARFNKLYKKASDACSSNSEATEYIWTVWTNILTNAFCFAAYLAVLSGLHPLLMVVVLLTTAAGYFVNKRIYAWGYNHRDEEAYATKRLGFAANVATNRAFAKEIRIFGLRPWLEDVWTSALHLYEAFVVKREKTYLWGNVVDLVLAFLRNGIAYAYLIWLTLSQGLPASTFLLYFTAVSGFSQWVTGLLNEMTSLHKQSLDISIVREFLDYPEPFQFEGGKPLQKDLSRGYEIRLENVSYRYPKAEKDTIHGMNLTIHAGEKLAIVGLNGAGKTTLVKLACGFLDPTEGCVKLNGEDIRTYNRRDYYKLFSAVFQDFSVLETTVSENVAQCVQGIDEERVWRCLDQAGLTDKVKSLPKGLQTHIGRKVFEDGVELSGGETQRLMLARALYKDGVILTLDEPTAALDPIAENDIYMKYNAMTAGKTSIFISHRLASTRFCDRILFLKDGVITEEGTHEELLRLGGGYAELFEVQKYYYEEGGEKDVGKD